jgi:hypothetical protein
MQAKVTLRIDDSLIREAKDYARREGKSLSRIVAEYFRAIQQRTHPQRRDFGPITTELYGCLKGTRIDEEDYRHHLEQKYK